MSTEWYCLKQESLPLEQGDIIKDTQNDDWTNDASQFVSRTFKGRWSIKLHKIGILSARACALFWFNETQFRPCGSHQEPENPTRGPFSFTSHQDIVQLNVEELYQEIF